MSLVINLRHVTQPAVLWRQFQQVSSIIFIDVKTKYRSPYLLDISQPYLQNHIKTSLGCLRDFSEGRPQDVGTTHHLELQIRPYWDVLVTSATYVLKMSTGDFPQLYIQEIMGKSSGRHISTSKGRRQGTPLGVTQRTIWERPKGILGM